MRPLALTLIGSTLLHAGRYVNASLPWHEALLDQTGKLLAWYHPQRNRGYDQVIRLAWDFVGHKVPNDARHGSEGLPRGYAF